MENGLYGFPRGTDGMGAHSFNGFPGCDRVAQGLPSPLASAALWLAADSLALANGDPVNSWNDLSTNAFAATPPGNAPTFASNLISGMPAVRFTAASSQRLNINATYPLGMPNGGSCFVVCKAASAPSTNAIRNVCGNADSGGFGWELRDQDSSGTKQIAFQITGSVQTANQAISTSVFQLIEVRYDMVTQSISQQGASIASTSRSTAVTNNTKTFYIGELGLYGGSNFNRYFDGWIAEIIVFNNALSTADTAIVRTYLNSKYVLY